MGKTFMDKTFLEWTRSGHSGRGGDRHPALPRRGLQLWISRTLCAAQTVGLAAACDGDVPIAGVQPDDDDHRGRLRTSVAIADAGRNDVAGDDGPRRIVDCAGLYRIFPGLAALGLDQRHAGDASHSGDGYSARLSRTGRKHLAARDRRRPRDRQRAAADRWARAQFRPTRARNAIAPSPTTKARPRSQGREPPLRAAPLLFEGADAHRTGIRANHAPLLAITGHEDVPVCRTAKLTFEGHGSRAVRIQMIRAAQGFALDGCLVAQRGLLAQKFSRAVEVQRAIMQVCTLAGENVAALKLLDRTSLLCRMGHRGQQE